MAKDLLRVESNERVDMGDFEFLANTAMEDAYRHQGEQFFCDPARTRKWVISGFAMSNPAGSQLQVTKGKAVLAYRTAGVVQYGMVVTEGDATKIVDLTSYSPGPYNVYIRFEYVPGDLQSRLFWDPSGTGTEFAQTINTRFQANWSLRVEASSPGDEWLKIGEVDQVSMDIEDYREFFFEGAAGGLMDLTPVFTWNGTTVIAATGADTSDLSVGDWITLKSDGWYYEITAITPNVDVTILNPGLRAIPSGATTSAKSSDQPYQSGWSTEGGGVVNDRNMDRAAYAVSDLQMFTAAMRQCIEDIKGRGLRKWWEKSIGGLNIGFDAEPVENFLLVGDANFGMYLDPAGIVSNIYFDSADSFRYDRASNMLTLDISYDVCSWDQDAFWPEVGGWDLGKTGDRFAWLYVDDVDVTNDLTARQLNVDGDSSSGPSGVVAFTNDYDETLGAVPANFSGSIKIYVNSSIRYLYFFDTHAGP